MMNIVLLPPPPGGRWWEVPRFLSREKSEVPPADVVLGPEVVRPDGPPAAVRVRLRGHVVLLQLLEQRREKRPRGLELVAADEEPLVPVDDVEDEALVGVRELDVVRALVLQVQLAVVQAHAQPRDLVVDLEVDGLFGLNADHELVGLLVQVAAVLPAEDVARHVPELHPDLGQPAVEGLARLHEERDAVPAGVADVQRSGGEGRAQGVLRHRLVVEVPRQPHVAVLPPGVLPEDDVLEGDGPHGLEHFDLLRADVLGPEAHGGLHGEQRQHLQQVVLHDVPDDAVVVEVAPAALGAEVLAEDDLHVADELPVPQGLEHEVAEAQHDEVLHQFLAQVVVDAVDLLLREVLPERAAELGAALAVAAEGLLHDHARPPRGAGRPPRGGPRRRHEHRGRQREVEDAVAPRELGLEGVQLAAQRPEVLLRVVLALEEAAAVQEAPHGLPALGARADAAREALLQRLPELRLGHGAAGVPVHGEVLGQQPLVEQGEERREDLLLRQVPRGPQHHHAQRLPRPRAPAQLRQLVRQPLVSHAAEAARCPPR
mmetsp:Transcript_9038/g.25336  ORF Transcript_9038/g.25336 Transcript_9038/m.25336 type:complete len:544 (-) Transcript_9038:129-1760(-)